MKITTLAKLRSQMGKIGGKARAEKLTASERRAIASLGGKARMEKLRQREASK